ncbi:MAG TPA: hypothetical protein VKR58_12230 [Aquella sp.]|nr:hypothetical protein [Aquella sp.]
MMNEENKEVILSMEKSFETNNVLNFLLWEIKCEMEKINKNIEILDKLVTYGVVKEEDKK